MCSNMWARPVWRMGSCTEPASTKVKKENTGASGRSQTIRVRPFSSFFTLMRFSKEVISCAAARAASSIIRDKGLSMRCFIGPPEDRTDMRRQPWLDEYEGQTFEITWQEGRVSTSRDVH